MPLNTPGFDFASRDYENIRRDLLRRAELVIPEWTDRDPGDFTMMLIDLWAYMGDVMHYYIDRAAGEAFIDTASQKESVLALANLFDYAPRTRSAARTTVYISNASSASVTIPSGTVFVGDGGTSDLTFFSTQSLTISSGQQGSVVCQEGEKVTNYVLVSNATGQVGQNYTINDSKVIPSTVRVYVYEDGLNPTQWTRVASIDSMPTGMSGFSTYVDTEGFTRVVFGNRISGRVPPPGVKITVDYESTNGADGNIGVNKIMSFRSNPVTGVSIASSTAATGGSNGESVESIKRSIKATIRTQARAVTLQDYVAMSLQLSGVYKAVAAYTPGGSGGSVSVNIIPYIDEYNAYTSNTISIDSDIALNVKTVLQAASMLGITVTVPTSVTVRPRTIAGTIYITPGYVASMVLDNVKNVIDNLFILENLEFGKDIRIGNLYRVIHAIEGVDYAELTVSGTAVGSNELIRLNRSGLALTTSGGITAVI